MQDEFEEMAALPRFELRINESKSFVLPTTLQGILYLAPEARLELAGSKDHGLTDRPTSNYGLLWKLLKSIINF